MEYAISAPKSTLELNRDVTRSRFWLQRLLCKDLAELVLDWAGIWYVLTTENHPEHKGTSNENYVYMTLPLPTSPLLRKRWQPRRITVHFESHDQGWTSNDDRSTSYTWSELVFLRNSKHRRSMKSKSISSSSSTNRKKNEGGENSSSSSSENEEMNEEDAEEAEEEKTGGINLPLELCRNICADSQYTKYEVLVDWLTFKTKEQLQQQQPHQQQQQQQQPQQRRVKKSCQVVCTEQQWQSVSALLIKSRSLYPGWVNFLKHGRLSFYFAKQ